MKLISVIDVEGLLYTFFPHEIAYMMQDIYAVYNEEERTYEDMTCTYVFLKSRDSNAIIVKQSMEDIVWIIEHVNP